MCAQIIILDFDFLNHRRSSGKLIAIRTKVKEKKHYPLQKISKPPANVEVMPEVYYLCAGKIWQDSFLFGESQSQLMAAVVSQPFAEAKHSL
jgi:hypothetical protein